MPRYMVFDLETESHMSRRRKANPFDKRNWIVAVGWKLQGAARCQWTYHPTYDRSVTMRIPEDVKLLVGFNIKFDLHWLWDTPEMRAYFKRGGKIWDCQYVEYLLEGQKESFHMCALNDVAPRYGGTKKIDAVKEMWEAGYLTSQIPEDLLIDYLVGTEEEGRNGGDVRNTELVFLGQVARMRKLGMSKCIPLRMDGLLATTEMEYNGIKVDMAEAERRLAELEDEYASADAALTAYIPAFPEGACETNSSQPLAFNWNSITHKSALIFGGAIKYRVRVPKRDEEGNLLYTKKAERWPLVNGEAVQPESLEPDGDGFVGQDRFLSGKRKGEFKWKQVQVNGELKTQWEERIFDFPGYVSKPDDTWPSLNGESWESSTTDARGHCLYKTGNLAIEHLETLNVPFCKIMGRRAALNKEIGTYYRRVDPKTGQATGMLTCVDPETSIIHHKLNHTSTVTTRLSGSDPNMQNISRGDKSQVKKMFVSRFGADGKMIESDYSQLEVVVQGMLSQDVRLCEDLRNKIDFHCKRVALKFGVTYDEALYLCKDEDAPEHKLWKKRRTGCKVFSFQRAYGAGAPKIAACTGMSVEDVQELIAKEDEEYCGVAKFNESIAKSAEATATPFRDPQRNFQVYRRGYWQAPTGTLYSWRTWDAPAFMQKRGVRDTFSPPELKNYPVQGTGGEIVQAIMGKLWRHFVEKDNYGGKAFLVNTVHDCIWVDCHKDVLTEVGNDVKRIMESVPELFNGLFPEMNITVPFPVSVECGDNMLELHEFHAN